MKSIGIDIGTTSICGVMIDEVCGKVIKTKNVSSEAFITTENSWEKIQDPKKILHIAKSILEELLSKDPSSVRCIGITGQMHGIVYTDKNGEAVSPLYTWQDGRGNLPYGDTTYARRLGSFSGYGNVTDFYNRENGLVPENAVSYSTIHDYFAMHLCGLTTPLIHASDAASLGLYDAVEKRFSYEHCKVSVTDEFEIIGEYCGIPVSVAIGDNQASVFATLADDDSLLINVGTGSQISIVSNTPLYGENIECRPYVGGKYLIVGAALCGGRAYSLLAKFYGEILSAAGVKTDDVYWIMARMISGKGDTSLSVDTRFDGTRKNTEIRGSISGISTSNFTAADLTLGVLEGITSELYGMYLEMGCERFGIVGSGNGIRKNPALVSVAEKIFGGELKVPEYPEEAACGAALFALVACGAFTHSEVKKLIKYEDR